MFWMSDIVRGTTRPPPSLRLSAAHPGGQPNSSDSPQHLGKARQLSSVTPASGSKTSVACCLPGKQTLLAEEEDATTITRQRTTDQATDRDRVGQTEEFLGRR